MTPVSKLFCKLQQTLLQVPALKLPELTRPFFLYITEKETAVRQGTYTWHTDGGSPHTKEYLSRICYCFRNHSGCSAGPSDPTTNQQAALIALTHAWKLARRKTLKLSTEYQPISGFRRMRPPTPVKTQALPYCVMPYLFPFPLLTRIISRLYVWEFEVQEIHTQQFNQTTHVVECGDCWRHDAHSGKESAFMKNGIFFILTKDPLFPFTA